MSIEKTSPIGFFDSGVGGLSVLAKFRAVLENENILYFGDLKNLPYGNKSKTELVGFAQNILDFFESKNVKAVVIACNTSSALAYESIKNKYNFKIYPIIQSCAKKISNMGFSTIGVFATQGTIFTHAYKNEINKYDKNINVIEIACPNWVEIVEGIESNIDEHFDLKTKCSEMLKYNPQKIILGCTHYPYLIDKLTEFVPREMFINPSEIFVDFIKEDLEKSNLLNPTIQKGIEEFFVSARQEDFVKNAQIFYQIKQNPQIINLA